MRINILIAKKTIRKTLKPANRVFILPVYPYDL